MWQWPCSKLLALHCTSSYAVENPHPVHRNFCRFLFAYGLTSENDSDEILTLDRPSIIVCDHAKGAHAVFPRLPHTAPVEFLKPPLEAPGFNADRLLVSEDI